MNRHYEDAATLCNLADVKALGLTERQIAAAQAQAEATLALAYEQRTANLIAYLAAAASETVGYAPPHGVLTSVQADIEVRIGVA